MARSVRIELILDTLRGQRGAKDLSRSVGELADNMTEADRAGTKAGQAVDNLGDQSSEAARAAATLDRQIDQLSASLREMALASALSGGGITKQMRQAEAQLRGLSRNRNLLGDASEPAAGFVANLSARMGPLLARMPVSGPLAAGIGLVGAAMAPMLGGVIAGAVVGGIGTGGVIGGLALVAKDERVQLAANEFGGRIEARLYKAGGAMVQPAIAGLNEIESAADTIDIEGIFRDSARYVPILTTGVASAVESLGNGVGVVVDRAEPAVRAMSNAMASTGEQIDESLRLLSTDAEAGASSIEDLTLALNYLIQTSVGVVHGLAQIKSGLDSFDAGIDTGRRGLEDLFTKMAGGRAEFDITADGMTVAEARAKELGIAATEAGEGQRRLGGGSFEAAAGMKVAAEDSKNLEQAQKDLGLAQKGVTEAQNALKSSLDSLAPSQGRAMQLANGLRTASQNLFGAQIAGVEANEAYAASWDALSGSVKANKGSLDLNTGAGRANRDSLQALLGASNEMYLANIAQGQSTDGARKKHEQRTEAVRKEAIRLGLNKDKTNELIKTYGQIPGRKTTDLVLDGMDGVISAMNRLYWAQRALAEGKTVEQITKTGHSFRGFHDGGYTGDVGRRQAAGIVHGQEMVIKADSTAKIQRQAPGLLEEMNATGQVPGYRKGGMVAPVDTSRRWPYAVNMSKTQVMSMEQALAKVAPAFTAGNWPSSPGAQRGDSGVWKRVVQLIKSGPKMGSFGNGYRPGDPKWHGSGRAVDWMGYNMDPLARFLVARKPLEFIHRTKSRDYAYTRGRNMGSFSEGLMNAHRNHIHIAMQNGGVIREPVFGVGRSGKSYSFAENGRPERVLSAGQTAAGGGGVVVHAPITINGADSRTVKQLAREVSRELGRTVDIYSRNGA